LTPRSDSAIGIALALAAAGCWSLAGVIVRGLDLPAVDISFWRSAFMAAALLPVVLWRGRLVRQDLRQNPATLLASGALLAICFVSYILALGLTTVANVAFVLATSPFLTALIALLWIGERIPRSTLVAMIVAGGGLALTVADSLQFGGLAGLGVALLTPLTFALNAVTLRRRRLVEPLAGLILAALISAAATVPFVDLGAIAQRHLAPLLVLGPVQLALGLFFFTRALRYLPAAQATLIANIEMVLNPLWVWLVHGERPSFLALVGGGFVLAAVMADGFVQLRRSRALSSRRSKRPRP